MTTCLFYILPYSKHCLKAAGDANYYEYQNLKCLNHETSHMCFKGYSSLIFYISKMKMVNSRNDINSLVMMIIKGNDGPFLRSLNLNAVIKPVGNHGKQV